MRFDVVLFLSFLINCVWSVYANESITLLDNENKCSNEISAHCKSSINNELLIMQCLMSKPLALNKLSDECHNFLWKRRVQLTQSEYFTTASKGVCNVDLNDIDECNVLNNFASKIPCLFEHKTEVKNTQCYEYLNLVGEIILADYRLVYRFIESCKQDIEKYNCGRIKIGPSQPEKMTADSQGDTINCLSLRIEKLSPSCSHQIFRISELQSDDFHLDRPLFYACVNDRELLCHDVVSGNGQVFECLMSHKFNDKMSKTCRDHLTERQKLRSRNYRNDYQLVTLCQQEIIDKKCEHLSKSNSDKSDQSIPLSALLVCLQEEKFPPKKYISAPCLGEIKSIRHQLMEDYSLTPELILHCGKPIDKFCKNHKFKRNGAVLHCLMGVQRSLPKNVDYSLSEACKTALHDVIKIANVVEDVRVDPVIRELCSNVLNSQCSPTMVQDKHVFDCLLAHRKDRSMTDECRHNLYELEYIVSRDLTLDASFYRACEVDAEDLCHVSKAKWTDGKMANGLVAGCLWSHRHASAKPRTLGATCLREVSHLMLVRASSVDLNPEVFHSCLSDLGKFCLPAKKLPVDDEKEDDDDKEEEEGIACLEDHLVQLQPFCREALVAYAKEVEEEPELDQRMASSCVAAEERFCAHVPPRIEARTDGSDPEPALRDALFECLVEHKHHVDMEPECTAAVEHFQIISLQDVRISNSFNVDCRKPIEKFCSPRDGGDTMHSSKLEVVMCLSAKLLEFSLTPEVEPTQSNIINGRIPEKCARHLRYELLSRSETLLLDPQLAEACDVDRKQFCANSQLQFGEVLECLREHRDVVSEKCHRVLFQRDQMAAVDSRTDYNLLSVCQPMMHLHCARFVEMKVDESHQASTSTALIDCLDTAMTSADHADTFDPACRHIVLERLKTQRLDLRLSPKLNANCRTDVKRFCKNEVNMDKLLFREHGNYVIRCLERRYFIGSQSSEKLAPACARTIRSMLISSNLNHKMDPVLVEVCQGDLREKCSEELALAGQDGEVSNGGVGECLRRLVTQNAIRNESCVIEVLRLSLAGKADISVDTVLSRDCAESVRILCGNVAPGDGRQMKCLLDALDSRSLVSRLEPLCYQSLVLRRQLWTMSAKLPEFSDWGLLIAHVNNSVSRNVVIGILLAVVGFIFILGLCCARVTKILAFDAKNR